MATASPQRTTVGLAWLPLRLLYGLYAATAFLSLALLALLPMGVLQLQAALEHGYWYARSADFMGRDIMHLLVWMRVPGDTVFAVGALVLSWFVLRLWLRRGDG